MSTEVREWWRAGDFYVFLAWCIRATADVLVSIKMEAHDHVMSSQRRIGRCDSTSACLCDYTRLHFGDSYYNAHLILVLKYKLSQVAIVNPFRQH